MTTSSSSTRTRGRLPGLAVRGWLSTELPCGLRERSGAGPARRLNVQRLDWAPEMKLRLPPRTEGPLAILDRQHAAFGVPPGLGVLRSPADELDLGPERHLSSPFRAQPLRFPCCVYSAGPRVGKVRSRALPDRALSALLVGTWRFVGKTAPPRPLTARQSAVVRLVADGLSNRQIAQRLGISENGVKRHLSNLFGRYDVESRAALVHQALGANSEEERLFGLLRSTLADVLGQPATDVLLRRAAGSAALPDEAPDGDATRVPLPRLLEHLWRVLFATTGDVVTRRLERAGFHGGPPTRMEERQP
ncbi:MAG TPA: LuxR C-terminal-related transcriptional regulator [Thermoanaerobaculia bacterium]|nr:LuxR C-terminal-related transcriptional regulator [Thermoanaerobaculia bacterium]